MLRIRRDHLRVDVGLIPPLEPDVLPRVWFEQLCASFYFADLSGCLLRLGVQSGVGEETFKSRARVKGGSPLGPTITELVNRCVDGWKDEVGKGRNPGIMHTEIAVPPEYSIPVLGRLMKFASYADGKRVVDSRRTLFQECEDLSRIDRKNTVGDYEQSRLDRIVLSSEDVLWRGSDTWRGSCRDPSPDDLFS